MANKWIAHIKKTMKQMKSRGTYKKGMGLKQVIKEAKKSWSKHKGGDGEMPVAAKEEEVVVPEGGRRRKHHKTHRRSKH
jgi:hypothetical protein